MKRRNSKNENNYSKPSRPNLRGSKSYSKRRLRLPNLSNTLPSTTKLANTKLSLRMTQRTSTNTTEKATPVEIPKRTTHPYIASRHPVAASMSRENMRHWFAQRRKALAKYSTTAQSSSPTAFTSKAWSSVDLEDYLDFSARLCENDTKPEMSQRRANEAQKVFDRPQNRTVSTSSSDTPWSDEQHLMYSKVYSAKVALDFMGSWYDGTSELMDMECYGAEQSLSSESLSDQAVGTGIAECSDVTGQLESKDDNNSKHGGYGSLNLIDSLNSEMKSLGIGEESDTSENSSDDDNKDKSNVLTSRAQGKELECVDENAENCDNGYEQSDALSNGSEVNGEDECEKKNADTCNNSTQKMNTVFRDSPNTYSLPEGVSCEPYIRPMSSHDSAKDSPKNTHRPGLDTSKLPQISDKECIDWAEKMARYKYTRLLKSMTQDQGVAGLGDMELYGHSLQREPSEYSEVSDTCDINESTREYERQLKPTDCDFSLLDRDCEVADHSQCLSPDSTVDPSDSYENLGDAQSETYSPRQIVISRNYETNDHQTLSSVPINDDKNQSRLTASPSRFQSSPTLSLVNVNVEYQNIKSFHLNETSVFDNDMYDSTVFNVLKMPETSTEQNMFSDKVNDKRMADDEAKSSLEIFEYQCTSENDDDGAISHDTMLDYDLTCEEKTWPETYLNSNAIPQIPHKQTDCDSHGAGETGNEKDDDEDGLTESKSESTKNVLNEVPELLKEQTNCAIWDNTKQLSHNDYVAVTSEDMSEHKYSNEPPLALTPCPSKFYLRCDSKTQLIGTTNTQKSNEATKLEPFHYENDYANISATVEGPNVYIPCQNETSTIEDQASGTTIGDVLNLCENQNRISSTTVNETLKLTETKHDAYFRPVPKTPLEGSIIDRLNALDNQHNMAMPSVYCRKIISAKPRSETSLAPVVKCGVSKKDESIQECFVTGSKVNVKKMSTTPKHKQKPKLIAPAVTTKGRSLSSAPSNLTNTDSIMSKGTPKVKGVHKHVSFGSQCTPTPKPKKTTKGEAPKVEHNKSLKRGTKSKIASEGQSAQIIIRKPKKAIERKEETLNTNNSNVCGNKEYTTMGLAVTKGINRIAERSCCRPCFLLYDMCERNTTDLFQEVDVSTGYGNSEMINQNINNNGDVKDTTERAPHQIIQMSKSSNERYGNEHDVIYTKKSLDNNDPCKMLDTNAGSENTFQSSLAFQELDITDEGEEVDTSKSRNRFVNRIQNQSKGVTPHSMRSEDFFDSTDGFVCSKFTLNQRQLPKHMSDTHVGTTLSYNELKIRALARARYGLFPTTMASTNSLQSREMQKATIFHDSATSDTVRKTRLNYIDLHNELKNTHALSKADCDTDKNNNHGDSGVVHHNDEREQNQVNNTCVPTLNDSLITTLPRVSKQIKDSDDASNKDRQSKRRCRIPVLTRKGNISKIRVDCEAASGKENTFFTYNCSGKRIVIVLSDNPNAKTKVAVVSVRNGGSGNINTNSNYTVESTSDIYVCPRGKDIEINIDSKKILGKAVTELPKKQSQTPHTKIKHYANSQVSFQGKALKEHSEFCGKTADKSITDICHTEPDDIANIKSKPPLLSKGMIESSIYEHTNLTPEIARNLNCVQSCPKLETSAVVFDIGKNAKDLISSLTECEKTSHDDDGPFKKITSDLTMVKCYGKDKEKILSVTVDNSSTNMTFPQVSETNEDTTALFSQDEPASDSFTTIENNESEDKSVSNSPNLSNESMPSTKSLPDETFLQIIHEKVLERTAPLAVLASTQHNFQNLNETQCNYVYETLSEQESVLNANNLAGNKVTRFHPNDSHEKSIELSDPSLQLNDDGEQVHDVGVYSDRGIQENKCIDRAIQFQSPVTSGVSPEFSRKPYEQRNPEVAKTFDGSSLKSETSVIEAQLNATYENVSEWERMCHDSCQYNENDTGNNCYLSVNRSDNGELVHYDPTETYKEISHQHNYFRRFSQSSCSQSSTSQTLRKGSISFAHADLSQNDFLIRASEALQSTLNNENCFEEESKSPPSPGSSIDDTMPKPEDGEEVTNECNLLPTLSATTASQQQVETNTASCMEGTQSYKGEYLHDDCTTQNGDIVSHGGRKCSLSQEVRMCNEPLDIDLESIQTQEHPESARFEATETQNICSKDYKIDMCRQLGTDAGTNQVIDIQTPSNSKDALDNVCTANENCIENHVPNSNKPHGLLSAVSFFSEDSVSSGVKIIQKQHTNIEDEDISPGNSTASSRNAKAEAILSRNYPDCLSRPTLDQSRATQRLPKRVNTVKGNHKPGVPLKTTEDQLDGNNSSSTNKSGLNAVHSQPPLGKARSAYSNRKQIVMGQPVLPVLSTRQIGRPHKPKMKRHY